MKTHPKTIIFILAVLALVSLSCALPNAIGNRLRDLVEDQAPEIVQQAEEIIEQNPAVATEVGELAEQVTPPENPEEVVEQAEEAVQDLVTTITGNDTSMLDSYRTRFTINADGSNPSGYSISQRIEMSEEMNRTQSLYHNKIHATGSGEDSLAGDLDLYILGDQLYIYDPSTTEFPCIMVSSGMETFDELEYLKPEDFFESVETGELLEQGVMVNGVLADHYRVSVTGIDMVSTASESGEIWIAQDGGYIVRYRGTAQGTFDTGEETGDGSVTWEYDLLDVNNVPVIDFPVECRDQQAAVEEVPIPENAQNKQSMAGIITFESPDGPEEVGEFYRNELPANGWRITEDSVIASLVMMTAEKDGQSLQIMITTGESTGSSAIISTIPLE